MLATTSIAPSARAAEPVNDRASQDPKVVAEQLHAQALEAFKKGERQRAIALWRSANARYPFWKYAYNIANALYLEGSFEEAWTFLEEARATMKEQLGRLDELDAKLSLELAKTHGWLEVRVMPEDALVKRNGEIWRAPRRLWTQAAESKIEVSAPGYQAQEAMVVAHAVGQRTTKEIILTPIARGELVVNGTPAGATVRIGEVTIGALPSVGPVVLAPGQYEVVVDDPDYLPLVAKVEIVDGGRFELPVVLRKKPTPSAGLDTQQTVGIVVGGVGALTAGIVGGILLSSADDAATKMEQLNDDELRLVTAGGYDGYRRQYDDLDDEHDSAELGAAIAIGLGGAAVVTGIILFVTGGPDGPPETKGRVDVGAGGSPTGLTWTFGF